MSMHDNYSKKLNNAILLIIWTMLACIIYSAIAYCCVFFLKNNGEYPSGVDTLCHLYKGDVLYQSICNGNWWPAYDPLWYNGVEMLRYWAPLPVFALAGCEALAGGNPLDGFLVFVGISCFLCSISWFYVGYRVRRPRMGFFIGLIWFFVPNNLIAMFYEGNLPRTICMILLPILVYRINDYLENHRTVDIPLIAFVFMLIALCHSGYAGMILISLLIFFVVYSVSLSDYKYPLHIVIALALGYMLMGVWLVPSLIGGITSTDSSEIMKDFFQSFWITINPFERIKNGCINFYFGMSLFALGIFGFLFSKKKQRPAFLSGIIIVACTSNSAYIVLSKMPGGQYLWMLRFISIAICLILFAFLQWKTLRIGYVLVFCLLILADIAPSYKLIWGTQSGISPEQRMSEYEDWTLLHEAKSITDQRLALIDESALDAMSAYLLTGYGKKVATTYGAAWQSSTTATNFKQVDRSLEEGQYLYLFDRCLELGNDTVVIRTNLIKEIDLHSFSEMDAAAEKVGYSLVDYNMLYRVYKLNNSGNFGVISDYNAIAIGNNSQSIARFYPQFKETTNPVIDEYSYEELTQYKLIYLNGFKYNNKELAEELIRKLSSNGVKIIIDADGIPEEKNGRRKSFLGAVCNPINFSQGYPILDTKNGELDTDFFPQGHTEWSTYYVNGLDNVWGRVKNDSFDIPFIGTIENDNIVIIGLNLLYYYSITQDKEVGCLLNEVVQLDASLIPTRTIVPLTVEYNNEEIRIKCEYDDVNSTFAYHDSFSSSLPLSNDNNLTVIGKGNYVIKVTYPYLRYGIITSIVALSLLSLYTVFIYKKKEK